MRPLASRTCLALAALALRVPPAHSQQESEINRHYPVTDPKNFTRVVATIGDRAVTAQEFLLSYEFGPAFPKRGKDSRERYLDFMVNEKLLALDAYARGLQSSPTVKRSLQELEGDMATEELYREDVLGKVSISDQEMTEGVRQARIHYSVQWLFTPGEQELRALERELAAHVPFDSLYMRQFQGQVKREDRSMETTLFKLKRASPLLAAVADTLAPGALSGPVRGPDGYYIMRVASGWKDAILSQSAEEKLFHDVRDALTQAKSDSLSDRYVRQMMLRSDPVIVRRTFDMLRAYMGTVLLQPDRRREWDLGKRFRDEGDSVDYSRIDGYGEETLVTLKGGKIPLREFLSWYRDRDTYIRLNTTSQPAFFTSMEDLVWHMVRDRLLVERALKRGLQEKEVVKRQLKWWEDKILFGMEKNSLGATIPLTDSAYAAYYGEHTRDYRDDKGIDQPLVRVKEQVRKDYYTFELKKRMLHMLIALKRKYPVRIHGEVLKSVPVDQENQPKAIDVYVAKKGGTFPHPAFPTIDYEWQSWY